jgi:hypothetical protein
MTDREFHEAFEAVVERAGVEQYRSVCPVDGT